MDILAFGSFILNSNVINGIYILKSDVVIDQLLLFDTFRFIKVSTFP